jgi:hypothetical protein
LLKGTKIQLDIKIPCKILDLSQTGIKEGVNQILGKGMDTVISDYSNA